MKTLYLNDDGNVIFDAEALTLEHVYSTPDRIRRVYIVKEPMDVVYKDSGVDIHKHAEKDDIVILFYNSTTYKYPVVITKCPEWVENVRLYDAREQEEKLKWASTAANTDKCDECRVSDAIG